MSYISAADYLIPPSWSPTERATLKQALQTEEAMLLIHYNQLRLLIKAGNYDVNKPEHRVRLNALQPARYKQDPSQIYEFESAKTANTAYEIIKLQREALAKELFHSLNTIADMVAREQPNKQTPVQLTSPQQDTPETDPTPSLGEYMGAGLRRLGSGLSRAFKKVTTFLKPAAKPTPEESPKSRWYVYDRRVGVTVGALAAMASLSSFVAHPSNDNNADAPTHRLTGNLTQPAPAAHTAMPKAADTVLIAAATAKPATPALQTKYQAASTYTLPPAPPVENLTKTLNQVAVGDVTTFNLSTFRPGETALREACGQANITTPGSVCGDLTALTPNGT